MCGKRNPLTLMHAGDFNAFPVNATFMLFINANANKNVSFPLQNASCSTLTSIIQFDQMAHFMPWMIKTLVDLANITT